MQSGPLKLSCTTSDVLFLNPYNFASLIAMSVCRQCTSWHQLQRSAPRISWSFVCHHVSTYVHKSQWHFTVYTKNLRTVEMLQLQWICQFPTRCNRTLSGAMQHGASNVSERIYLDYSSSSSSSIGTTTLVGVSACSTVVEHYQQEGFRECRCQRHLKPPTWRRTRDLERSNFRQKRPPASEATLANPAAEGGTMSETWPRYFAESGDFHFTFGFFYIP
jgi:hypothetical protein